MNDEEGRGVVRPPSRRSVDWLSSRCSCPSDDPRVGALPPFPPSPSSLPPLSVLLLLILSRRENLRAKQDRAPAKRTATTVKRSPLGLSDPFVLHLPSSTHIQSSPCYDRPLPPPLLLPSSSPPAPSRSDLFAIGDKIVTDALDRLAHSGDTDLSIPDRPGRDDEAERQMVEVELGADGTTWVCAFPSWRYFFCVGYRHRRAPRVDRADSRRPVTGEKREGRQRRAPVGGVFVRRPGTSGLVHLPDDPWARRGVDVDQARGMLVGTIWVEFPRDEVDTVDSHDEEEEDRASGYSTASDGSEDHSTPATSPSTSWADDHEAALPDLPADWTHPVDSPLKSKSGSWADDDDDGEGGLPDLPLEWLLD